MLNPIKYILIIYCACNQEFLHLLLLPLPSGIKYCPSSILNKSLCQVNSICFVLIACNETSDRDRDNWRLVCRCQCLSSSKPQRPELPVAHIMMLTPFLQSELCSLSFTEEDEHTATCSYFSIQP